MFFFFFWWKNRLIYRFVPKKQVTDKELHSFLCYHQKTGFVVVKTGRIYHSLLKGIVLTFFIYVNVST